LVIAKCKEHMIGFYDCCYGEEKRLRIQYRFRNKLHECEYGNKDVVHIPQKGTLTKENE
jgi:Domain of unknown function (DUF3395)